MSCIGEARQVLGATRDEGILDVARRRMRELSELQLNYRALLQQLRQEHHSHGNDLMAYYIDERLKLLRSVMGRYEKKVSRKQEERVAADLGGRVQANSGAMEMGGGADVRVAGHTRVECKYTESPTYTLKLDDLEKLRQQSMQAGEAPVMQIEFRGVPGRRERFALVPWPKDAVPAYTLRAAKSTRLTRVLLCTRLLNGRFQLLFQPAYAPAKAFELMYWSDYLEQNKES